MVDPEEPTPRTTAAHTTATSMRFAAVAAAIARSCCGALARDQKTGQKLGNFNKDYAKLIRRYYCNSINVCQILTTSISPWDTSKQ